MKLLLTTSLAWVAACTASPSPSSPDATPAAAAPTDAAWSSISSTVVGAKIADGPIAGATICVLDHAEIPCATSDADGDYTISLPDLMDHDIAVEASASGYLAEVTLLHQPADSSIGHATIWESELLENAAEATAEATQAGFTYPQAGTGFLQLRIDDAHAGYPGATVAIAPLGGGTAAAKGPVYWDANGPDPSLTASAALGVVTFGDVAPGKYAITVTAPGATCTVGGSNGPIAGDWAPMGSSTTVVEIAGDAYTMGVSVICD